MTRQQLNKLTSALHDFPGYRLFKTDMYTMLNKYRMSNREETYDLQPEIVSYAEDNNIPKPMLYALLHEIILELQKDVECSEELYDLLTNYLDGLEQFPLFGEN